MHKDLLGKSGNVSFIEKVVVRFWIVIEILNNFFDFFLVNNSTE